MMKIPLVLIITLITGPVGCFDVVGYPGGCVIVFCTHVLYRMSDKYFCKLKPMECIRVKTQRLWVHADRVSVFDSPGVLTVVYRGLRSEDAGLYQCGETGVLSQTVNLKVKPDPCCLTPKTVIGYLGEALTINCSYPAELERNHKLFYRVKGQFYTEVVRSTESRIGRFSISDDRRSKVVSVRISDVREDDGGGYYCAVGKGGQSLGYTALFKEIQLQVKESYRRTSAAPTATASEEQRSTPGFSVGIITVSICVVLLLIGGLTLIFYRLRRSKTEGSTSPLNTATTGNLNKAPHSDSESIRGSKPDSNPGAPADPLIQNICRDPLGPSVSPEGLVYATVSFQTNPGSRTGANIGKEEPQTEYAIIKHPTRVDYQLNTERC